MWSYSVGDILGGKKFSVEDNENYYKILGCGEDATNDQIMAEYRILALKCHPDKNPGDENALVEFQKLQEARDTLIDPTKRRNYDKWKNGDICISYKQWLSMNDKMQTAMHWAKPKQQTMLECPLNLKPRGNDPLPSSSSWAGEEEKQCEKQEKVTNASRSQSQGQIGQVKWGKEFGDAWTHDNRSRVYNEFRNYQI